MRHLVTGAGSGIGAAVTQLLHARGDDLVLVARSAARADELATAFPGAELLVADLADPAAVEALRLPDGVGRLDSVVHAAGVVDLARVAELDATSLQHQLAVNLVAPALMTRALLPALRAAGGTVVLVNSGAGLRANPEWGAYAASKFGLRALADALRAEEPALRVTSVFPGRTASPMQARVHEQEGHDYDATAFMTSESVAASIVHVLDLPADTTVPELVLRTAH